MNNANLNQIYQDAFFTELEKNAAAFQMFKNIASGVGRQVGNMVQGTRAMAGAPAFQNLAHGASEGAAMAATPRAGAKPFSSAFKPKTQAPVVQNENQVKSYQGANEVLSRIRSSRIAASANRGM